MNPGEVVESCATLREYFDEMDAALDKEKAPSDERRAELEPESASSGIVGVGLTLETLVSKEQLEADTDEQLPRWKETCVCKDFVVAYIFSLGWKQNVFFICNA